MRFIAAADIREKDKIKVEEIYDNDDISNIKGQVGSEFYQQNFTENDCKSNGKK
jgi:hypothetical protein